MLQLLSACLSHQLSYRSPTEVAQFYSMCVCLQDTVEDIYFYRQLTGSPSTNFKVGEYVCCKWKLVCMHVWHSSYPSCQRSDLVSWNGAVLFCFFTHVLERAKTLSIWLWEMYLSCNGSQLVNSFAVSMLVNLPPNALRDVLEIETTSTLGF